MAPTATMVSKVKGLIGDTMAKLGREDESEAIEKPYCSEQTAKAKAKKEELDGIKYRIVISSSTG